MVRLLQIFFHGSYGLAEGYLTNADTALLTLQIIRSGSYSRLHSNPDAQGLRTYVWNSTSISGVYSRSLWAYENVLSTTDTVVKCAGYVVRLRLSLIFSPEAMGWPRDLV